MTTFERLSPQRQRDRAEHGFTLVETLVSLAILSFVIIGVMTAAGALTGGVLAARMAGDYTVGSVYLSGLNEFIAGKVVRTHPQASIASAGSAARRSTCPRICQVTRSRPDPTIVSIGCGSTW